VTLDRRAFLAVADGRDAIGIDAERDQIVLRRVGTPFAERQVVLAGTAFVAVPYDRDADLRVGHHPFGPAADGAFGVGRDNGAVVREEDRSAELDVDVFLAQRVDGLDHDRLLDHYLFAGAHRLVGGLWRRFARRDEQHGSEETD
jgi:hypothetical protein